MNKTLIILFSLFFFNISACEICDNLKNNNHSVLRPQYRQLKEKIIERINNNQQTTSDSESKNSTQLIFCLDFKIEKRLCKELQSLYPELDEITRHNVIKQTIKSDLSEFFKENSVLQPDNNEKIIGITALSTTLLILTIIKGKGIIQKRVVWKQPSTETFIKNFITDAPTNPEIYAYGEQLKELSEDKIEIQKQKDAKNRSKIAHNNGYNEGFKKSTEQITAAFKESQEWNQVIEKFNTAIKKTIEASEEFKTLDYQIYTAYTRTLDKCIKQRNLTEEALINTLIDKLNKNATKTIAAKFIEIFVNNLNFIS